MEWVSLVNVARSEHVRGTYGVGHYEVTTDYTDDQFTLTIDRCHFEQEYTPAMSPNVHCDDSGAGAVTLFLCGDVMTGRGIDQILPHPSLPELHEYYARSACLYIKLAESVHGEIPTPIEFLFLG